MRGDKRGGGERRAVAMRRTEWCAVVAREEYKSLLLQTVRVMGRVRVRVRGRVRG